MRTFREVALLVVGLQVVLAGCAQRERAIAIRPDPKPDADRGIVVFFHDGAVVQWNYEDSGVLLTLPGESFARGEPNPYRPDLLMLLIDGRTFQIVDLDSTLVAGDYTTADELLAKHRQWETHHWEQSLGAPLDIQTEEIGDCDCNELSLWALSWPEEFRAARKIAETSQVFLSLVVGRHIVVVSSGVMEGQSPDDLYAYMRQVARDALVSPKPIDQKELRHWLDENGLEPAPAESY